MPKIHFVLQGKGGVGKSMCAFFLVQFLRRHDREVAAFDADPVNSTLYAFASSAGYPVERVELLDEADMLDPRRFDLLVDQLSRQPERTHSVVDNGSSSFLAAMGYLRESGVFDLLRENGHTVYAHTVITGGQAARDTLNGLEMLEKVFPGTPVIVWRNPFFGEVPPAKSSCIDLPEGNRSLSFRDVELILAEKLSFEDAMRQAESLMVRERLKTYWNRLCEAIEATGILREDDPPSGGYVPTEADAEGLARGEESRNERCEGGDNA